MPSLKRLLAVMGTIVALTALAPVASAASPKDFYLDKTCAEDPSEPLGFFCTVEHSDFKWIPAGTEIHYAAGPADNVQIATIAIANGSTTGVCTWSSDVDAICVFSAGTGRLTQFKLDVVVTASADQSVWYWIGTYWHGQGVSIAGSERSPPPGREDDLHVIAAGSALEEPPHNGGSLTAGGAGLPARLPLASR